MSMRKSIRLSVYPSVHSSVHRSVTLDMTALQNRFLVTIWRKLVRKQADSELGTMTIFSCRVHQLFRSLFSLLHFHHFICIHFLTHHVRVLIYLFVLIHPSLLLLRWRNEGENELWFFFSVFLSKESMSKREILLIRSDNQSVIISDEWPLPPRRRV